MWFAGVHLTNAAQTCIRTFMGVICDTRHGDVDFGVLCQVPDIMSTSLTPDILTGVSFSVSDISSKTVSSGMCTRMLLNVPCVFTPSAGSSAQDPRTWHGVLMADLALRCLDVREYAMRTGCNSACGDCLGPEFDKCASCPENATMFPGVAPAVCISA